MSDYLPRSCPVPGILRLIVWIVSWDIGKVERTPTESAVSSRSSSVKFDNVYRIQFELLQSNIHRPMISLHADLILENASIETLDETGRFVSALAARDVQVDMTIVGGVVHYQRGSSNPV